MTGRADPTLRQMINRFWDEPDLREWLGGASRVGVAVSGGADSMALLRLLAGPEAPDWAPGIVAMHVHHGLRPRTADRDMRLARDLARDLGIPFRYRRLDGARLRNAAGGSLEAAARDARYRALRDMARAARCDAVALAHHEDDLAETLLMRLLRGSGLSGLGAFGPVGCVEGLRVVRPLVGWSREDIRGFAERAGIRWGEDETNSEPAMLRNRIRAEALPCLERLTDHPPASRMIARAARLLAREGAAVDAIARRAFEAARRECRSPRRVGLDLEALRESERELLPYLLRMLAMDATQSDYPPSLARLDELDRFARAPRTDAILQSERNLVAWIDRTGVLWLYQKPRRRMSRDELLRFFRKGE